MNSLSDAQPLPEDPVTKAISERTPASSSARLVSPPENTSYTIDEAIADAIEQMTNEPLPDPFTSHHHIEYWIWTGTRLVPASSEEEERLLLQEELAQEELELAAKRRRARRLQRWQALWGVVHRLLLPVVQVAGKRQPGAPKSVPPRKKRE